MQSVAEPVRPPQGAVIALAIALGSAAVLLAQEVVRFAAGLTVSLAYSSGMYDLAPQLGLIAFQTLVPTILLAAGVFLSLWRLAPVTAQLRVSRVILNSLVAAGIGVGIAFLGAVVWLLAFSIPFEASYFGNSFPMPGVTGNAVAAALVNAATNAVTTFMNAAPIVVLAGVLAWIRLSVHAGESLRSDAPSEV